MYYMRKAMSSGFQNNLRSARAGMGIRHGLFIWPCRNLSTRSLIPLTNGYLHVGQPTFNGAGPSEHLFTAHLSECLGPGLDSCLLTFLPLMCSTLHRGTSCVGSQFKFLLRGDGERWQQSTAHANVPAPERLGTARNLEAWAALASNSSRRTKARDMGINGLPHNKQGRRDHALHGKCLQGSGLVDEREENGAKKQGG